MTALEKAIITEINKLRSNPECYVQILKDYMDVRGTFEGQDEKLYKREGKTTIKTKEGKAAVREAIQTLEDQVAVNELQPIFRIVPISRKLHRHMRKMFLRVVSSQVKVQTKPQSRSASGVTGRSSSATVRAWPSLKRQLKIS